MPTPEQLARGNIDAMLTAAGWVIQDRRRINLHAAPAIALCETDVERGFADYGLFLDAKAIGVLEAKAEGTPLVGVADQSEAYARSRLTDFQRWAFPLPFTYESNGEGKTISSPVAPDESAAPVDLEETGQDEIAKLISAKFKGHGLARLVNAILRAQGYTTYLSPAGTDAGIDILAGAQALGFSAPKICVQVKSQESPVGRPEVDQLIGAMDHVKADAALFVAWGGFKQGVHKELASRFFRVRLWSQKELLEHLFANYDRLDEDLRAELPLKRIWTVAAQEE
jgi:Restriction endonuclease